MSEFNPNGVGIANGNYFGLPYSLDECKIVLIPVPWDVTVSYGEGTSLGPEAIMDASIMFDLFDPSVKEAWKCKIGTLPLNKELKKLNTSTRKVSKKIIEVLASGEEEENVAKEIKIVNDACEKMNKYVYEQSQRLINEGKIVAVVGGEHSVPYGLIKAISEKYKNIGILHIDAHADLREAYEGFTFSHASIMYNVINNINEVASLSQVAIRDFCDDENNIICNNKKIKVFTDNSLRKLEFCGKNWDAICDCIIDSLPENIYISFDIDGLSPELCPNTGTPVPGGLSFNKADYLLEKLSRSGKKIRGFDLVEVAPGEINDWDANVGARLLYKLCLYANNSIK